MQIQEGITGKITFAISGAVLGTLLTIGGHFLAARNAQTTILPNPFETIVEAKKTFVEKADFNEFIRQYRDDIRRIEQRVQEDLREASAIRQTISGQIGEMRGELRQISQNISQLQKNRPD